MMDGTCISCGKYLWDQKVYERAEEYRRERELLLASVERYKQEVEWLRAAIKSERDACFRSCKLIAEDCSEMADRDGAAAATLCAVMIQARGGI